MEGLGLVVDLTTILPPRQEPYRVLHAGSGRTPLPAWLSPSVETRLDINPDCAPDIVASIADLGDIGPFDVVYTCHTLEHLHPSDVDRALAEFHRVLAPRGIVIIFVPDLEDVRPTDDVLYTSAIGPITGLDMIYGKASLTLADPYMLHRTGFTATTLGAAIYRAGFVNAGARRLGGFNLMGAGEKA